METLDAASRQSVGLPSINNMDIKREEEAYHRKHPGPAIVSPLQSFPGPPLSHSNHQSPSASAVPGPLGGLLSPPESRRTSGDEKEQQRGPGRQSLPSIHEALGADQSLAFSAPAPPPSAPAPAPQPYFTTTPSTAPPSDQRKRPFPTDLHGNQGPANPFSHPRSPFMNPPASSVPPPPPPPSASTDSLPRPSFSEARSSFSEARPPFPPPQQNPKLPTLHPIRTTQSPPPGPGRSSLPYSTYPPSSTPVYETSAPHSAGPMNPHYGYSQYPPNYPLSAPAPSGPSSAYPPSATYSAPPRGYPGPPAWPDRSVEEKKINPSTFSSTYGSQVVAGLVRFDLEASLNEMAEGAGRITDFSKIYRQRNHENSRIAMPPQSMPRLEEVDDMLQQSEKIQLSLQRLREIVYNHHQASVPEPPQDAHYRPINGHDHDARSGYGEDMKASGGYAGPDPKKRRGRAAPPGRCHSCNRAETPEWRRGPDGARTLCNACGLHYAKLTRKMGGKAAMTSSNLRPKSLDQGSPA